MVLIFKNVCNRQGTSRPVDNLGTYSNYAKLNHYTKLNHWEQARPVDNLGTY
jgi:hypothetical protein